MLEFVSSLRELLSSRTDGDTSRRGRKSDGGSSDSIRTYDKDSKKPVLKCSICNGEQVAGFKDIHTGKFEEVTLIRNEKELEEFMKRYGIKEISKEY